jgi:hypothetical protein
LSSPIGGIAPPAGLAGILPPDGGIPPVVGGLLPGGIGGLMPAGAVFGAATSYGSRLLLGGAGIPPAGGRNPGVDGPIAGLAEGNLGLPSSGVPDGVGVAGGIILDIQSPSAIFASIGKRINHIPDIVVTWSTPS